MKTGIKALVRAPRTRKSKSRLGNLKEAKKTPNSSGVNLAERMRNLITPKSLEAAMVNITTVAAEMILVCRIERRETPLLIKFFTIALYLLLCYN